MESKTDKPSSSSIQDSLKSFVSSGFSSVEPESHLENLGLTINNGKARFRLNEDAPLYTSQNVSHFTGTEDENDTLSFVVLSKDSMDMIQQLSMASYTDIEEKCMSIDYSSMISSLDASEINQKLNELLQENAKLKEALKQNNVAMKQQFNTLAKRREELMQIHQNHERKFSEMRELVNYLKKLKVEHSMELVYEMMDANETVDKELTPQSANSLLSDLEMMLNEAINTKNNEKMLEQSEEQNKVQSKIQEQSSTTEEKPEQPSANIEKINQSSTINEILKKPLTSIDKAASIDEIVKKFVKLNEGNVKGTAESKKLSKLSLYMNEIREGLEEKIKQLETGNQKLQIAYEYLNTAKELLKQQRHNLQQEQTSLDQQSQLYEIHHKIALDDEKKFNEKCEEMTKEIRVLHETIERKEACIKRLESELSQQKEEISLLKTQLKVYEDDFNQEKVLKEELMQENAKLNENLQQEITVNEVLRDRIVQLLPQGESIEELEQSLISNYQCPVCNVYFRKIEMLEAHVSQCLNID